MDKVLQQTLITSIDSHQSEINHLLQELIRIRSYSGEEEEIVTFIISKMKEYGFTEAFHDDLGNAVGRIGQGPLKILWDAHIDTVRVTEGEDWRYPPFEGVIENGVIHGRGAVDEKPAMAGFLIAAKAILEHVKDADFPFTLYVVGSVVEEDCDGYPLRHLIEKEGIQPDVVLLGEPTDLQVYRGQRGRMEIEISTQGKSAHGAHNQQGINAIYKMVPLIQALESLDNSLKPVSPLGKGSITVSNVVSRGPSLCSVPDQCQIHIDRRLTVNENENSVLQEIRDLLKNLEIKADIRIPEYQGKSWTGLEFRQEAYFPTWMLEEGHNLVKAARNAAEKVLERLIPTGFWDFSTNGVATAGRLGIPTIGFAPGKEELAHTAREELNLHDLLQATQTYALFPFYLSELFHK
ncbi:MAG: YgeY family selenium metabolism-linked hydrolase [Calditrichia bacterium]|nr:YgeY family selenium metabolism-linked hydrolase [Calditrichia bacterium]